MAKFPTEAECETVVRVSRARVYAYLFDVAVSGACAPSVASCERVAPDTYRFASQERGAGPVTIVVRYTARYQGNGTDRITFESVPAPDDNAEIDGTIRLEAVADDVTRVVVHQRVAPDVPVPRLLQGLIRSFVDRETAAELGQFLDNVRRALEERPET